MGPSISGTLSKWDTSLNGTLFSVPKPNMNLTKWDTLLFENSPADVFITVQGKSGIFCKVGDNKTNKPDNEEESAKECEGEEEKEEITLKQALKMATKLKMYCVRKDFLTPTHKSQVSEIAHKIMNFNTNNL